MHAIIPTIILACLLILPAFAADAAIYSYKDANGRTVYVDDEHKIPTQYRSGMSTIQERREPQVPAIDAGTPEGTQEGTQDTGAQGEGGKTEVEPPAKTLVDRDTQLRARQQTEMLDRERAFQTPVMVRGNRVLVPVEIAVGNRKAHMMLLLDTGSTSTVLHRPAVKDLPFAPGEKITARVAGGRTLKSEKVVTRYLDIGPFEMKDFPVMLIDPKGSSLPFDGMLGMDFLKDHPYVVDYENEMIHWKPTER